MQHGIVAQGRADHQQGLGKHGVRIRQSCLRPWPGRVGTGTAEQDARIGQQVECPAVAWAGAQDFAGSERGVCHRTRRRRSGLEADDRGAKSEFAHVRVGAGGGAGAETPQGTAPVVIDAGRLLPGAVGGAPVPESTLTVLGADGEPQIGGGQVADHVGWLGLPGCDHQTTRDIVQAEAVVDARLGEQRVLEQARPGC